MADFSVSVLCFKNKQNVPDTIFFEMRENNGGHRARFCSSKNCLLPRYTEPALYVGNLDESASEEKLLEFIEKRSIQAGLKRPKVHTCSIIRREEGELGSWGAHLVIDHGSHELLNNRNFWPGRVYARPWTFRGKPPGVGSKEVPRNGDHRPT